MLEQIMAIKLSPDHKRQLQVWELINLSWNTEPYQIRRILTETSVRASNRRAVIVVVEAYKSAGGTMLHGFFQVDDGGWFEDPALLDRLVNEKLQGEAKAIASEGCKWIEATLDLPYGYSHGLRRLASDPAPMADAEGAALAKLLAENLALKEEYSGKDEVSAEIDARLDELEMAMEALDTRPLIFDPAEIAWAGVFVKIDLDGRLAAHHG